jgi:alkylresorcinol/alkylpyrone synthase
MEPVRIVSVGVAHPPHWIEQEDAARRISDVVGDHRRIAAIARGSQINRRALALPPDEIGTLGSIAERNRIYAEVAPRIAIEATAAALPRPPRRPVGFVVTSSCTGYMVPGWDVRLSRRFCLPADTVRLPITEAGCAGGVVALSRAADYLRLHPERSALAVSAEVCSLAFQPIGETGNLTSALLFGDGAGAALLEAAPEGDGLEIVDALSLLLPDSEDALGFALTDGGFYPVLTRDLADILPGPTRSATDQLIRRNGLQLADLSFALVHPGGPRILSTIGEALDLPADAMRWSWCSLREAGNTSSAAVIDVIGRYLADADSPRGWGLVAAFGPGLSVELLLVRRC